ncbi:hypothetical protein ACET3Z_010937 [Daucus carota]
MYRMSCGPNKINHPVEKYRWFSTYGNNKHVTKRFMDSSNLDKARAFPPSITCEWFDIRWCSCIRHPESIIILAHP